MKKEFEGPPPQFELPTEPESSEKLERAGRFDGNVLNHWERIKETWRDENVRDSLKAAGRTVANVGVSIVDMVPGAGDAVSWAADVGKLRQETDLTPDVSKKVAWSSEALEAVTGGAAPSHAIETAVQLKYDVPRMKRGYERLREIWTTENRDYAAHQPEIDQALETFAVEPPGKENRT